jgi:hypothetical protein
MDATYSTQIIDSTPYGPNGTIPGFIEYVVRFTNTSDITDTFDGRIDADGSSLDLQNKCRIFLQERFPAAPANTVPADTSFTFHVADTVTLA